MKARFVSIICGLIVVIAGCSSSSTTAPSGPASGGATVVGKWAPSGDEAKDLPEGSYLEFTEDGKATMNINNQGKMLAIEIGKYKVEGDKINMTEMNKGKEETKVSTIKTLTADEFVFVNSKGEEKKLKRFK